MPRELPSLHTFPELSVDHGLLGREAKTFAEMSRSQQVVVLINQKIGKKNASWTSSLYYSIFLSKLDFNHEDFLCHCCRPLSCRLVPRRLHHGSRAAIATDAKLTVSLLQGNRKFEHAEKAVCRCSGA
jgi:hypothetical protein